MTIEQLLEDRQQALSVIRSSYFFQPKRTTAKKALRDVQIHLEDTLSPFREIWCGVYQELASSKLLLGRVSVLGEMFMVEWKSDDARFPCLIPVEAVREGNVELAKSHLRSIEGVMDRAISKWWG